MPKNKPGSSKTNKNSIPKLEITEKVKVLCLHGYRQTGESFKSKLGSFRKHTGKYAEFVFVTAPHKVPPDSSYEECEKEDVSINDDKRHLESGEPLPSTSSSNKSKSDNNTMLAGALNSETNSATTTELSNVTSEDSPLTATTDTTARDERSWWFNSKDEKSFKGTNKQGPAFKFEESLRYLEKVWQEQGPFQGILGFSQGACFVGLLCGIAKRNFTIIKPEFVIISSGFLSGSLVHMKFLEDIIEIPSLHIYGETDEIIPRQMSEALVAKFENPQILIHSGGHYFPATSAQKETYIHFFQDRLQEYLEAKELEKIRQTILDEIDCNNCENDDDKDEYWNEDADSENS